MFDGTVQVQTGRNRERSLETWLNAAGPSQMCLCAL